jgi:hypothetical protein
MKITFSEASGLQDTIFGKCQHPVQRVIERRGEEFEQTSLLKKLFLFSITKNYGDLMTAMTAMNGFLPVGELGAVPIDGFQQGFSKFLGQMTWKNSFALSREIVDDAKIIDIRKRPESFIVGYLRTRERFGAALYGGALSGLTKVKFGGMDFDVSCADGKPVFDKEHPAKVKGAKPCNVFSDAFSAKALGRMETVMQNFKGDNEELLDVSPTTILIPNDADLKESVFAAIGADKNPVNSDNAYNYQFGRWNVSIWPYLNPFLKQGVKPWVLLDPLYNDLYGGACWNDRVALEVKSTVDDNVTANKWWGYARYNATFNDWRFAAVGGITGGASLGA